MSIPFEAISHYNPLNMGGYKDSRVESLVPYNGTPKFPKFNNFTVSAIATLVAELFTAPICLIRTNVINTGFQAKKISIQIYNEGGIKAFYRASLPAVCGQVFSSASKFALYTWLNKNYNETNDQFKRIINGIITSISVSILTHPIDSIKDHLQMGESVFYKFKIRPLVIYDGFSKTLIKASLSGAFFFPLYELIKDKTNSSVISGITSAVISTILMQPLDYMKKRQIYGLTFSYNNLRIMFTGLELNLFRVIPHFTIMMFLIEKLKTNS